jgi:Protein of unknown function (DUF3237)
MNTASELPSKRVLLDRALLYLFSYNVEAATDVQDIGLSPAGLRVNVECIPNGGRVYNVLGERTSGPGFPSVTGRIVAGGDRALIREDDVTISNVRMTIQTDDNEFIDSSYGGVCPLGQGGFRSLVSGKDKLGTLAQPLLVPVVVTPRYETSVSSKYAWLMSLQAVGFGRLEIVRSVIRRITYDIYSMT